MESSVMQDTVSSWNVYKVQQAVQKISGKEIKAWSINILEVKNHVDVIVLAENSKIYAGIFII